MRCVSVLFRLYFESGRPVAHDLRIGNEALRQAEADRGLHRRLAGKRRGRKRRTTISDEAAVERAHDLLLHDFAAARPREKPEDRAFLEHLAFPDAAIASDGIPIAADGVILEGDIWVNPPPLFPRRFE
jgi:hypothetical protein